MEILKIKLIGDIEIKSDKTDILPKLSSKSIAIIAVLICNENNKMSRERLATMLWADSFDTASYNLRYNLWNIKKVIPKDNFGNDFITTTKDYCQINPKYSFSSDVLEFENLNLDKKNLGSSEFLNRLINAKNRFKGDFLDEFYIKDSDEYNEWILSSRAKYQKKYIECLNLLLYYYIDSSQYEKAIEILEDILKVNPYDEEAYYNLMKLYIEKNERHKAVLQYKKCYNILRQELNIVPQKKIKELYMSITDENIEKIDNIKDNVVIKLNQYFDPTCEYILMSELSEKLLEISGRNQISGVCKRYWMDISEIQPRALDYIEMDYKITTIKDIRLYNSLKNILRYISNEKYLNLLIANKEHIDAKSKQFLGILSHSDLVNITYLD